jgi:phage/plasmid-like protein (TIGR03299 family)
MSHMIEISGDLAAFVSSREVPWHRLGTTVDADLTVEEALDIAHLAGWDVRKSPVRTRVNGKWLAVEDKYVVVRNDPFNEGEYNALGIVGKQYQVVQNEEHGEFLNALADGGAKIETAGSLKGGREIFFTMKVPQHILVGGVDNVDLYISAFNSHDGSTGFRVITTPVRTVCKNTQVAALAAAKRRFSKRHTSGLGGAVARAREELDLSFAYAEEFEAEAEKMIQETLTKAQFEKITKNLFPVKDDASDLVKGRQQTRLADLSDLFVASPTMADIRNTRWAGYQAVTEYFDHFVNMPSTLEDANLARAEKVFGGEYDDIKALAFKTLQVA